MNKLLRTITFLALEAAILILGFNLVGCSNGSGAKGKERPIIKDSITIKKRDTTKSLALYKNAWGQETAGFINKARVPDTLTLKLFPDGGLWERGGTDSFYIIPTMIPDNDSLGSQKKDSLGRPKFKEVLLDTDKKWIIAEIPYVDSLVKQFKKLK